MKYLMWKDKGIIEAKFHSFSRGPEKKEENTDATSCKFPYSKTVWGFLKVKTIFYILNGSCFRGNVY